MSAVNNRPLDRIRGWIARRRGDPPPEPGQGKELERALWDTRVAGTRLYRSLAELEAEVMRRRRDRA